MSVIFSGQNISRGLRLFFAKCSEVSQVSPVLDSPHVSRLESQQSYHRMDRHEQTGIDQISCLFQTSLSLPRLVLSFLILTLFVLPCTIDIIDATIASSASTSYP